MLAGIFCFSFQQLAINIPLYVFAVLKREFVFIRLSHKDSPTKLTTKIYMIPTKLTYV